MAEVAARDIQKLRHEAGVGMMDAKKALTDAGGDADQAMRLLRQRGQTATAKRAGREAHEGAIGSYIHVQNERPVIGVLIELACETDFVAKSDEFRHVADDIAMHVSWSDPRWITREEVDPGALADMQEDFARRAEAEGKPAHVVERVVEGKIEAWYAENVLYEQAFINSERFDGTVGAMVGALAARMGENISVRRISRFAVGG